MKSARQVAFAIDVGLVLLAVAPAFAQRAPMRANIPFTFVAGNTVLPSGEYLVTVDKFNRVLFQSGNKIVPVEMRYRKTLPRRANAAQGTLQFRRFGDMLVLSRVWQPGEAGGSEVKLKAKWLEASAPAPAPDVTLN
jgi:hypothetical protein